MQDIVFFILIQQNIIFFELLKCKHIKIKFSFKVIKIFPNKQAFYSEWKAREKKLLKKKDPISIRSKQIYQAKLAC